MPPDRVIHLSKMTGAAGSEGHLLTLLPGLRARGVDARLWILVEPDKPVDEIVHRAESLDVPVERVIIRRDFDPGLWRGLARRFRAARPEIVHTHLLHADLYGIPAARRAGVPCIVTSRHNDDRFRRWPPMRWLNRWLWRQVSGGIAISDAIRAFSIEVEGAPADRVRTVRYGLDPASVQAPPDARARLRQELGLPPGAPLIGSVCRLIEQKGLDHALDAFALVAAEFPAAHYVIAGDGPLRGALATQAARLGLAAHMHFLGWRDDAPAIFAALDVLLAPSLWEGFGLVFLEAMACGVPVISTRVSAIPEVIADGETGWLVPPGDPAVLAGALRVALSDPDERRRRGEAGRARLEAQFTVDAMVGRTLALYQEWCG
ncbi:MAG: glycosyltransferase [Anaerolineae bacterium]|nr:glycosyltransferase [Anaerolineae bacterium]